MATNPYTRPGVDRGLGTTVQEVAGLVQRLVREEIALAQAELTIKVKKLLRGVVVGLVGAIFGLIGVLFLLQTVAFGLGELMGHIWLGFLVTTLLLFALALVAVVLALRFVKQGTPPTPELALQEAQRIRETVTAARS